MMIFIDAIQGILVIVVLVLLGYWLAYLKWFGEREFNLFSKLVINIALPCYMVYNFASDFELKGLLTAKQGVLVPFISILFAYFLAFGLGKIARVPEKRAGLFRVTFAMSNTIFVGLPLTQVLLGEEALPYVLLYYFGNTTLFWTLGVWGIISDATTERLPFWNIDLLKRVLNPPLIAFFIGVGAMFFELKLPEFALKSLKMVGGLTTPLALFCVGMNIRFMGFRRIIFDSNSALALLGRFLFTPLITWLVSIVLGIPELMKDVFVVVAAMPVMMQSSVVARFYEADFEYATSMVAYSTLLSIIIAPLMRIIIAYW
ncbi:AEC family transporter [Thermatribacter velox]|jgi:hypothetical protein|uniref:AEC family transporter n=1 Tax=Thermatribacter velox TaxID=3039681 RepID=A0ABZ2YFW7_9BACT